MALQFPSNPSIGDIYSSGSSAIYEFNGSYWDILEPTNVTIEFAKSASVATTASYAVPQVNTVVYKNAWNFSDAEVSKNILDGTGFTDGTISINYTPKYSTSKIIVTVSANIKIFGSGQDAFQSSLSEVNSATTISEREVVWGSTAGDYARSSGYINALAGVFYNTDSTTKQFGARWFRTGGDDVINAYFATSMIMIEEIRTV
jgi:hypothetical protein